MVPPEKATRGINCRAGRRNPGQLEEIAVVGIAVAKHYDPVDLLGGGGRGECGERGGGNKRGGDGA